VSTTKSTFCVLGDDVAIACAEKDVKEVYDRYSKEMTRFGAKLNLSKSLISKHAAEGAGALFLKDYPNITIRIPKGKVSTLEINTKGTLLHEEVGSLSFLGRMVSYRFMSKDIMKSYTFKERTIANTDLCKKDLSLLDLEALRSLSVGDNMPRRYSILEESDARFYRACNYVSELDELLDSTKFNLRFLPITKKKYIEKSVNHKIISLLKERKSTT
jgi:lipopolysaccharide biosynthesis glycosyltransferase